MSEPISSRPTVAERIKHICYDCRHKNRRFLSALPQEAGVFNSGNCDLCGNATRHRELVVPRGGMPWPSELVQQTPDDVRPDQCPYCCSLRTAVNSRNTGHFLEGMYMTLQCIDCNGLFTLHARVDQLVLYNNDGKGHFVSSIGPWPPPAEGGGEVTRKIRVEDNDGPEGR